MKTIQSTVGPKRLRASFWACDLCVRDATLGVGGLPSDDMDVGDFEPDLVQYVRYFGIGQRNDVVIGYPVLVLPIPLEEGPRNIPSSYPPGVVVEEEVLDAHVLVIQDPFLEEENVLLCNEDRVNANHRGCWVLTTQPKGKSPEQPRWIADKCVHRPKGQAQRQGHDFRGMNGQVPQASDNQGVAPA